MKQMRRDDVKERVEGYSYQIYLGNIAENEFLLCYNDCIIELRPDIDMELTKEVKAKIGEILE